MTEIGRTLPIKKVITTESSPDKAIACTDKNQKNIMYECYERNPLEIGTSGPLFCDKNGKKLVLLLAKIQLVYVTVNIGCLI